ncbi:MAG: pyridoxamine 5'-phosphate oxidase family protein [Muribaculaceae bacterium]|nr:pyridoxamine 5'-phosphate oxidase family protein [Muribaculaceae bacterium]
MKKRMKAGFVAPLLMVLVAVALLTLGACDNKAATDATSNKTNNEAINDTISKETMEANMKEVQAYLKECGAFFIATVDGDQPRVRPFGVSEIINGRLYLMTGKVKDVYKQMARNGKFEICALKPSGSEWMRLSGTLVADETLAVKEEFLNRNEGLKKMYKADDDNMAVLYITQATARFCSFTEAERTVHF